jgi:FlaA1/EpsC-like NDP-sugar epimerase
MGQCKLLCEWIVETFGRRSDVTTRFVAVRFGNVLNSAGSVVPTFRRQIAKGGPVTVTHPDMTRYFMTIPEAASLVVQAGGIGGSGDVFVLDMGDPVKIVDLARNMIRLSGKQPDVDIKIDYVGTRPGETLYEKLWAEDESVAPTAHPKIMRLRHEPIDGDWLDTQLVELARLAEADDRLEVIAKLSAMVREPLRDAAALRSGALDTVS